MLYKTIFITLTLSFGTWLATSIVLGDHVIQPRSLFDHSNPESIISLTCGGMIELPAEGTFALVEYKASEQYNDNERCLWTLNNNLPNGRKFLTVNITLVLSNFKDTSDGVSVLHFNRSVGLISQDLEMGKKYSFDGEAIFLCFTSDERDVGLGFIIQIDIIKTIGFSVGIHRSYSRPFEFNMHSHKPSANDVTTISLNPIGTTTTFSVETLRIKDSSAEQCTNDVFQVFEIEDRRLFLGSRRMSLCGSLPSDPTSFRTRDCVLAILSTNEDTSDRGGFVVTWT